MLTTDRLITDKLITVTEAAENHFRTLLRAEEKKEEDPGLQLNLRVFVSNPGTSHADIGVTFCPEGKEEKDDIEMNFDDFKIFIEGHKDSIAALQDAKIDYVVNEVEHGEADGGQLSIKAPNLKGKVPAADSSLHDRVNYVLNSDINPTLAGHGGRVSLVDIIEETDGSIVVLQFGGGCHGCSMSSVTLKHGIEKTLKEKFPEIKEVRDATDHAVGENPFC